MARGRAAEAVQAEREVELDAQWWGQEEHLWRGQEQEPLRAEQPADSRSLAWHRRAAQDEQANESTTLWQHPPRWDAREPSRSQPAPAESAAAPSRWARYLQPSVEARPSLPVEDDDPQYTTDARVVESSKRKRSHSPTMSGPRGARGGRGLSSTAAPALDAHAHAHVPSSRTSSCAASAARSSMAWQAGAEWAPPQPRARAGTGGTAAQPAPHQAPHAPAHVAVRADKVVDDGFLTVAPGAAEAYEEEVWQD